MTVKRNNDQRSNPNGSNGNPEDAAKNYTSPHVETMSEYTSVESSFAPSQTDTTTANIAKVLHEQMQALSDRQSSNKYRCHTVTAEDIDQGITAVVLTAVIDKVLYVHPALIGDSVSDIETVTQTDTFLNRNGQSTATQYEMIVVPSDFYDQTYRTALVKYLHNTYPTYAVKLAGYTVIPQDLDSELDQSKLSSIFSQASVSIHMAAGKTPVLTADLLGGKKMVSRLHRTNRISTDALGRPTRGDTVITVSPKEQQNEVMSLNNKAAKPLVTMSGYIEFNYRPPVTGNLMQPHINPNNPSEPDPILEPCFVITNNQSAHGSGMATIGRLALGLAVATQMAQNFEWVTSFRNSEDPLRDPNVLTALYPNAKGVPAALDKKHEITNEYLAKVFGGLIPRNGDIQFQILLELGGTNGYLNTLIAYGMQKPSGDEAKRIHREIDLLTGGHYSAVCAANFGGAFPRIGVVEDSTQLLGVCKDPNLGRDRSIQDISTLEYLNLAKGTQDIPTAASDLTVLRNGGDNNGSSEYRAATMLSLLNRVITTKVTAKALLGSFDGAFIGAIAEACIAAEIMPTPELVMDGFQNQQYKSYVNRGSAYVPNASHRPTNGGATNIGQMNTAGYF